jgi:hypothetical protein
MWPLLQLLGIQLLRRLWHRRGQDVAEDRHPLREDHVALHVRRNPKLSRRPENLQDELLHLSRVGVRVREKLREKFVQNRECDLSNACRVP